MPGYTPETRSIARSLSAIHGGKPANKPLATVRCPGCRAKVYGLRRSGVCLACEVNGDINQQRKAHP